MQLVFIFLAGFLGGVIRALVGIVKKVRSASKKTKIRRDYIILNLLSGGGIGLLVGLFVNDLKLALLAGYAGTDFLESLFKIKMRKESWN
ncbi:MAG: hypothetical protein J7L08_01120 [Candidatus Aenigmarchaeota archaeon]|nr:hypothetical protein [Candidatus Aenigmarchaeota archaeon]